MKTLFLVALLSFKFQVSKLQIFLIKKGYTIQQIENANLGGYCLNRYLMSYKEALKVENKVVSVNIILFRSDEISYVILRVVVSLAI